MQVTKLFDINRLFFGVYRMKKIITFVLLASFLGAMDNAMAATDTATYSYDAQGRLKTITYTNGTTITYTYDSEGNRTSEQVTCSGAGC